MPRNYALDSTPANKMRRGELALDDEWIRQFLAEAQVGYLATAWDDQPFITPTNFWYAAERQEIYFHTNLTGRLRATPFSRGSIAAEVLARGAAQRGAAVFRRPELGCIGCHRVGDEGGEIGPRLDSVGGAQPLESLIGKVLEPQGQLVEGYETHRITTRSGEMHIGIIVAGNEA